MTLTRRRFLTISAVAASLPGALAAAPATAPLRTVLRSIRMSPSGPPLAALPGRADDSVPDLHPPGPSAMDVTGRWRRASGRQGVSNPGVRTRSGPFPT